MLTKFMSHDATTLELPDSGVVLVTGDNGSGKSSLVEAVSAAVWGKTLRGGPWWREGQHASAKVEFGEHCVLREWENGAAKVSCRTSTDFVGREQPTRCAPKVEAEHGTWEVWRRTCVFSSHDASHFSTATDAERKRLLESVLGLARFDAALSRCRLDLRAAEDDLRDAVASVATMTATVTEEERGLEALRGLQTATPPEDTTPLERALVVLEAAIKSAEDESSSISARLHALPGVESAVADARRRKTMAETSTCPTCGQRVSGARWTPDEDSRLAEMVAKDTYLRGGLDVLADLSREFTDACVAAAKLRSRITSAKEAKLRSEQVGAKIEELESALEEDRRLLAQSEGEVLVASKDRSALSAVESVLGLRGVRAAVLSRALAGVEATANRWLSRVAGDGARVRLRSYSETKSGTIADAISVEVDGLGGGRDYRSRSGGERRRVDVCLMLACAAVAYAAQPRPLYRYLWFDEVFDALDGAGKAAVASVLEELAADRCVVVVTHSEEMRDLLGSCCRVRVEAGRAEVVS